MHKSIFHILPIALGSTVIFSSCIFEGIEECPAESDGLDVKIEWHNDTTASPEGMSVLFYPLNGSAYWRYELPHPGGTVDIPPGIYNVVTYNNDTGSILFENQDDYYKTLITTRAARLTDGLSLDYPYSQPPRNAEDLDQPVVASPDVVWSDSHPKIVEVGVDSIIFLEPVPMVARYTVRLSGIVNLESVSTISMSISGLSAGRFLSNGEKIPMKVTVPGRMEKMTEDSAEGWLLGFGQISHGDRCRVSLYALLRNGERIVYEYDVSDIVADAPDPMDVEIHIEGLEFPVISGGEGNPAGGIEVGVDDWEVVDIELST